MLVNLRPWSISHVFSHTFLLALESPVAYFGPHLGGRIVGPMAPLGDLDTTCNSSYFFKVVMKMSDFDPFGEHDKPDQGSSEWPDEGEMIPLTPGGVIEGGST